MRENTRIIQWEILLKVFVLVAIFAAQILLLSCSSGEIAINNEIKEIPRLNSAQKVNIPEIFERNCVVDGFKLTYEADIVAPNVITYPVAKAKKRAFQDNELLDLIFQLTGSKVLFSEWELTKDEWLKKIETYKQNTKDEEINQEYISKLTDSYNESQDEITHTPVAISSFPFNEFSHVKVLSSDGCISSVVFIRGGNFFSYFRAPNMFIYTESEFTEDQYDPNFETKQHFEWRKPDTPLISRLEALELAKNELQYIYPDFILYESESCSIISDESNKSSGWIFTFVRSIAEINTIYKQGWIYINPNVLPTHSAPWAEEFIRIVVDEDGICMVWWSGASDKCVTMIDNTKLLEFSKVIDKATTLFAKIYGEHNNGESGLSIRVIKFELAMSMIAVDDSSIWGLYIPSWRLTFEKRWDKSERYIGTSQIVLSAIDGSYIEPRVTYDYLQTYSQ